MKPLLLALAAVLPAAAVSAAPLNLGSPPSFDSGAVPADVRPDARLDEISVAGAAVRNGESAKPSGGEEEEGDELDIQDPCPAILNPVLGVIELARAGRDGGTDGAARYGQDLLESLGTRIGELSELCAAGNMRALKESLQDAFESASVYGPREDAPEGSIDKRKADRRLGETLKRIYAFDPHLDPRQGRTMDPYR